MRSNSTKPLSSGRNRNSFDDLPGVVDGTQGNASLREMQADDPHVFELERAVLDAGG